MKRVATTYESDEHTRATRAQIFISPTSCSSSSPVFFGIHGGLLFQWNQTSDPTIYLRADNLLSVAQSMPGVTKIEAAIVTVEKEEFMVSSFLEELKSNYDWAMNNKTRLIWD